MCELRICRDIIDVPDLHICHVPLHVAQRFHVRKPKKYDVAGFEICWLAVVENNFTKSLYRIEVAENLDRKVMNLRRMAGALLEFTDELFALISKEFPNIKRLNHVQATSFKECRGGEVLICQAIKGKTYLDDYWRPRQTIRSFADYQAWVKENRPENLRHFQLHIPQALWDSIGEHVRLLGFTPTYRLATLAN